METTKNIVRELDFGYYNYLSNLSDLTKAMNFDDWCELYYWQNVCSYHPRINHTNQWVYADDKNGYTAKWDMLQMFIQHEKEQKSILTPEELEGFYAMSSTEYTVAKMYVDAIFDENIKGMNTAITWIMRYDTKHHGALNTFNQYVADLLK